MSTLTVFNTFKDAVLRDSVYDAAVLIETPLIKDGLKTKRISLIESCTGRCSCVLNNIKIDRGKGLLHRHNEQRDLIK